jgi:uncharacterized protein YbbK (DUF523 family)
VLIVSACLLGINCRFDGSHRLNPLLLKKAQIEGYIPVCPEQLGGLPIPRKPISICGGNGFDVLDGKCQVCNLQGKDLTANLISGSSEAVKIAKLMGIKKAIFKERSPSCGVNFTTSHQQVISGPGVTTALFIREGIEVVSDESLR